MNISKVRWTGSRMSVELLEEMQFRLKAYAYDLEIDNKHMSKADKAEKIFETATEIYVLERQLEILDTLNRGNNS